MVGPRVGPKAQLSEITEGLNIIYQLLRNFHNTFLHCRCSSAPNPRHSPLACSSLRHRRPRMDRQVGWGHPGQPRAVPAPGPSPCHAMGPCTASAPHQQLGRTIVQTQEGSDSRVSRAGRNQRRRHLLVSDNAADGGSETRAGEDRPSSPQESSRKGRAKPHSTRRLHFLELFALKGGSSALHAQFSPALPALRPTVQRGAGLLHSNLPAPRFGDGARGGLHPPRAHQEQASGLGDG